MRARNSLAIFLLGKVNKFKATAHARSPPFPDFSWTSLHSRATGSVLSVPGRQPHSRTTLDGEEEPASASRFGAGCTREPGKAGLAVVNSESEAGSPATCLFSLLEKGPNETYCDPHLAAICACFIDPNPQEESWVLGSGHQPCPSPYPPSSETDALPARLLLCQDFSGPMEGCWRNTVGRNGPYS